MFPFSHNPVLVPVLRRLAQGITLLYLAALLAIAVGFLGVLLGNTLLGYLLALSLIGSITILVAYISAMHVNDMNAPQSSHQSLTDGARGYTSKVA